MQEINCKEFDSLLAEYVNGGLEQEVRRSVAGHSLQCRSCRVLLDDVKVKLREGGQDAEVMSSPGLDSVLEMIPEAESDLSCGRFEELISDFLDGFVHASVYHKFARHSDACSQCSRGLTDVVYAVAACHSVHIYEEQDVPETLTSKLAAIGTESQGEALECSPRPMTLAGRRLMWWGRARGLAGLRGRISRLIPTNSVERVATVCGLVLASLAVAIFGPARDTVISGVFRKAQSRATSFYNHSVDIYSQREVVEARFERVGEDLGRVWKALGGTDSMNGEDEHAEQVPGHERSRATGQER
jgi:hypothetical protein